MPIAYTVGHEARWRRESQIRKCIRGRRSDPMVGSRACGSGDGARCRWICVRSDPTFNRWRAVVDQASVSHGRSAGAPERNHDLGADQHPGGPVNDTEHHRARKSHCGDRSFWTGGHDDPADHDPDHLGGITDNDLHHR